MKIVITPRGFANYGEKELDKLRSHGFQVSYNNTGQAYSPEKFLELSKNADGIIVGVDLIDQAFIDQCPQLKVICKFGVGTDNIDVAYAESKGIYVGRTIGSNSIAVAEHVMALIYSESKNIYETVREVKEGEWQKPTGRELYGKTIGIIGFGAIGKQLARQAQGVGMHVRIYDVYDVPVEELKQYDAEQLALETLLQESDYVSLHLPLTEKTKNLISTAELNRMKDNACLINTARGGIVDEEALSKALAGKVIRSACFDVFSSEPPKSEDPLLARENFYLTPHTGARTIESEARTCEISTDIVLSKLLNYEGERK